MSTGDMPRAPGSHSHLGVRIAQRDCLLDLTLAGELLSVPERVLPVPLAQPWLLGVFSLRGQLMTLIDLARYRGWGASERSKGARVLALSPALHFNAAILVDEVHGLHTPSASPQTSSSAWTTVDLKALVREPAFLMVSRLTAVASVPTLPNQALDAGAGVS